MGHIPGKPSDLHPEDLCIKFQQGGDLDSNGDEDPSASLESLEGLRFKGSQV